MWKFDPEPLFNHRHGSGFVSSGLGLVQSLHRRPIHGSFFFNQSWQSYLIDCSFFSVGFSSVSFWTSSRNIPLLFLSCIRAAGFPPDDSRGFSGRENWTLWPGTKSFQPGFFLVPKDIACVDFLFAFLRRTFRTKSDVSPQNHKVFMEKDIVWTHNVTKPDGDVWGFCRKCWFCKVRSGTNKLVCGILSKQN